MWGSDSRFARRRAPHWFGATSRTGAFRDGPNAGDSPIGNPPKAATRTGVKRVHPILCKPSASGPSEAGPDRQSALPAGVVAHPVLVRLHVADAGLVGLVAVAVRLQAGDGGTDPPAPTSRQRTRPPSRQYSVQTPPALRITGGCSAASSSVKLRICATVYGWRNSGSFVLPDMMPPLLAPGCAAPAVRGSSAGAPVPANAGTAEQAQPKIWTAPSPSNAASMATAGPASLIGGLATALPPDHKNGMHPREAARLKATGRNDSGEMMQTFELE